MPIDPEELAQSIGELVRWAQEHTPATESSLRRRIADHLGGDPASMPIVTEAMGGYELANLQMALDAWLEADGRGAETLGLAGVHGWRPGLGDIVRGGRMFPAVEPGPVEYASLDVGDRRIRAVRSGLFLLADGAERLAAAIAIDDRGMDESMRFAAMAADAATAESLVTQLRALMIEHNAYRGRVLVRAVRHDAVASACARWRSASESRAKRVTPAAGSAAEPSASRIRTRRRGVEVTITGVIGRRGADCTR